MFTEVLHSFHTDLSPTERVTSKYSRVECLGFPLGKDQGLHSWRETQGRTETSDHLRLRVLRTRTGSGHPVEVEDQENLLSGDWTPENLSSQDKAKI